MNNLWEEYVIAITHEIEPVDGETEKALGDITDRFETELFQLVKKYQGQGGLKFEALNSSNYPIMEYV